MGRILSCKTLLPGGLLPWPALQTQWAQLRWSLSFTLPTKATPQDPLGSPDSREAPDLEHMPALADRVPRLRLQGHPALLHVLRSVAPGPLYCPALPRKRAYPGKQPQPPETEAAGSLPLQVWFSYHTATHTPSGTAETARFQASTHSQHGGKCGQHGGSCWLLELLRR